MTCREPGHTSKRQNCRNAQIGRRFLLPAKGRDHVLPAFVSPSLTVSVLGGRPTFGTWQSVVLVDTNADNPDRQCPECSLDELRMCVGMAIRMQTPCRGSDALGRGPAIASCGG